MGRIDIATARRKEGRLRRRKIVGLATLAEGVVTILGGSPIAAGTLAVGAAVVDLAPRRAKVSHVVNKASKWLNERCDSAGQGLSTRLAVEERIQDLLESAPPDIVLAAALMGSDQFSHAVAGDRTRAHHDFNPEEARYFEHLLRNVHGLVLELVRDPDALSIATRAAVEQIQAALAERPTKADVDQMILAAVQAEIGKRPIQVVDGARPNVVARFVDRDEAARLRTLFADSEAAPICVLAGMRGSGKTQIAAAVAQECAEAGWDFVGWVNAESRAQAISEMAQIAERAGISASDAQPDDSAKSLVAWLNGVAPSDRLLVFDNAADMRILEGIVPHRRGLRVLITTTQQTKSIGTRLEVGRFTPEQASDYLLAATGSDDTAGAAAVAADLGFLPVAITQAAAAMVLLDYNFSEYQKQLAEHELDSAMLLDDGDPYPAKVGAALRIAYWGVLSVLAQESEAHRLSGERVLDAISLLTEAGVPREWLLSADEEELVSRRVVGELLRNSVLLATARERIVAAHGLMGRVIREARQSGTKTNDAYSAALQVLANGLRVVQNVGTLYTERRWSVRELAVQLLAVVQQPHSQALSEEEDSLVIASATIFAANELDDSYSALTLLPYVNRIEARYGGDDIGTLLAQNNLAYAYQAIGDLGHAIPLFESVLSTRTRLLGRTHPDTLTSQGNLAGALLSAGNLARALSLLEQALEGRERILGKDHLDTLTSRNNLAQAYSTAGDLNHAIVLGERAFSDRQRVLGIDHPDTIGSLSNLAGMYASLSDFDRAIALYEAAVEASTRAVGFDHPATLRVRNNLAHTYAHAGDRDRAIPAFEAALIVAERILGPYHPDTLVLQNNLASAYSLLNDSPRALALYEKTFADRRRLLGPDHPSTLTSQKNLASEYSRNGDFETAIPLFEEALSASERILGKEHPATLKTQSNLAGAYAAIERFERAMQLYREALTTATRLHGEDQPITLTMQNNLAHTYVLAESNDEAGILYEAALAGREKVLGADHLDTIATREGLMQVYAARKEFYRMFRLVRAQANSKERAFGANHPETLAAQDKLVKAYTLAGNFKRAIPLAEEVLARREATLGHTHPETIKSREDLVKLREDAI